MIRIFFEYIFPLVLPATVYALWVWYARHTHSGEGELPGLKKGPLFWCVLAGFALMVAGLAVVATMTGAPPGSRYEPPRLEGGKVVPPAYQKKE
ncbi:MAG TPA: DUF6111 family protein [Rhodospirillales bacterium]|jgi:hypothetical protein